MINYKIRNLRVFSTVCGLTLLLGAASSGFSQLSDTSQPRACNAASSCEASASSPIAM